MQRSPESSIITAHFSNKEMKAPRCLPAVRRRDERVAGVKRGLTGEGYRAPEQRRSRLGVKWKEWRKMGSFRDAFGKQQQ